MGFDASTLRSENSQVRIPYPPPDFQRYNHDMLDAIAALFSAFNNRKKDVWVVGYVEDNRTLLVGNGHSEKYALREAHSDKMRIVQHSKDGLLKAYFPPNISSPEEVPEDILKLINDHLGFSQE